MSPKSPIAMKDFSYTSKDRVVFTREQLSIPGIEMFGQHVIKSALPPLDPHYHLNCFEITILLEGSLTFEADHQNYSLIGGDLFLTFPNEIHSTNMFPMAKSNIIWFQIDATDYENLLFLDDNTSQALRQRLQNLTSHAYHLEPDMIELAKKAFDCISRKASPTLSASYLALFLQLLIHNSKLAILPISEEIQKSIDYIQKNITQAITLEEIAAFCNLSTSSYKQKFRAQVGISPRNYINMEKIKIAKTLLDSGYSITDTSMQLGFNTSSYFTKVFKKYTSQSPHSYVRKKDPTFFLESYLQQDKGENHS